MVPVLKSSQSAPKVAQGSNRYHSSQNWWEVDFDNMGEGLRDPWQQVLQQGKRTNTIRSAAHSHPDGARGTHDRLSFCRGI